MYKTFIFLLRSISYGLALAFVVLLALSHNADSPIFANLSKLWSDSSVSYSSAVRKAAPAVVNIMSESFTSGPSYNNRTSRGPRQSLGSGVIIQSNGYIVTNRHVVLNADRIIVLMQNGRRFIAELIGMDAITDLALLHVNAVDLPVIPQKMGLTSEAGDVVLAIGNPLNLGLTITQGIISATNKTFSRGNFSTPRLLQMDAAINNGNSGGALVNTNGVLIGINSLAFQSIGKTEANGISFALPYSTVHKIINKLQKDGRVIRGWLGVTGGPVNKAGEDVRSTVEEVDGIRLTSVDARSPAQRGGLRKNDIIQQINDKKVTGIAQILSTVEDTTPGQSIKMTVKRNQELLQLTVEISESR